MVENALFNILSTDTDVSALVASRIYPQVATEHAVMPYIVYTRITTDHHEVFDGAVGLARAVFQVDAWSTSYDTARDIAEKIRLVLEGYEGTAASVVLNGVNLVDDRDIYVAPNDASEPGKHSVQQDYAIWFGETATT